MRRYACLCLLLAAAPAPERVITGDGVIAVTVNGVAGTVRADPAAPGVPLVTKAFAARAHLKDKQRLGIGFGFSIGPTTLWSRTQAVRTSWGGEPDKQRVAWQARRFAPFAEGSVGPAGLPESVIRFVLRPAQAGERRFTLPIQGQGLQLFGGGWSATYALIDVGGEPMRVLFDPGHPRSLADAGAAMRLAKAQGGTMTGAPVATEIAYGIERPVRTMSLARPLAIGGLSMGTLGVRVPDTGLAVPEANAPPPDPAEVVVTAKAKKHDPKRDQLSLGADVLGQCSSIVFDKPAKVVRLSCL